MISLRILVVEDEPLIATLLADVLDQMGHNVCAVESTETGAVAAARKYHPQMMIVDDGLTEGSGITAIERILLTGFVPHILVSGGVPAPGRLGPRAVILHKPFHESDLKGAIHNALEGVSDN
jgi:CheY-like chemotaxis protein